MPAELEPSGLLRGDGKGPDGSTLTPWARGKCLVWDFTSPGTLAQSHLQQSSLAVGSAALAAEAKKRTKYDQLARSSIFVPFVIESLGAWGQEALAFSSELGSRVAEKTGERRSTAFFRQRMIVAIQKGNAASVRGTLKDFVSSGERDYIFQL